MKRSILVYIPKYRNFLYVAEGTGDNLLDEDIDQGYVDYVYIEVYRYTGDNGDLEEYDGGQMLLKDLFVDKYKYDDGTMLVMDAANFMWSKIIKPDEYVVIESESSIY